MATITPTSSSSGTQTVYTFASTATADTFVLPVKGCKSITIHAHGLSADTLVPSVTLDETAGTTKYVALLNGAGANPFAAPTANVIQFYDSNYSQLKVVRTGATDGAISIYISLQK